MPYSTGNMKTVVVADELKGKMLVGKDYEVTEVAPGSSTTIHAVDEEIFKRAGIVETTLAVANAIPDQVGTDAAAFSYTIPANTFSGGNRNVLTATKADNSALPGWMTFNPTTRVLSGTAAAGVTAVKITATSRGGQTVSDTFNVTIT